MKDVGGLEEGGRENGKNQKNPFIVTFLPSLLVLYPSLPEAAMPLINNSGMRISPHCTWRNIAEIHAVRPILNTPYGTTYEMMTSG